MSRTYDERDAAMAIPCPECGANPTFVCVDEHLTTVPIHQERLDSLLDLVRKGANAYEAEDVGP